MKKKGLVIFSFILIIVVIAGVIFFIKFTDNYTKNNKKFDIQGTWLVYQYADMKVENEFMVFQNGQIMDYRNGDINPYFSSSFTIEDGILNVSDLSKKYSIRTISDNNIILVEPDTREWKLIRVSDKDSDIQELKMTVLVGEYDVLAVGGVQRINEVMSFTDSTVKDFRNGELFLSSDYELESGHLLKFPNISKEFIVYKNDSILMLIDKEEWYVWELKQK